MDFLKKKKFVEFHYSVIEIEEILDLVDVWVKQTAFIFNGVFIKGLKSPLSSLLFDIYMHFFAKNPL